MHHVVFGINFLSVSSASFQNVTSHSSHFPHDSRRFHSNNISNSRDSNSSFCRKPSNNRSMIFYQPVIILGLQIEGLFRFYRTMLTQALYCRCLFYRPSVCLPRASYVTKRNNLYCRYYHTWHIV